MEKHIVTILDGTEKKDSCLDVPLSMLNKILGDGHSDVKMIHINDLKIAHCTGCFGCWVKTPGICVAADDSHEVIESVIQSDITILYTPVTFGGYSSTLKIVVDKFIPLALPFFGVYLGETHHTPRYSRYPRVIGIGVGHDYNDNEAILFKALVGRNALNFHAPSYAAEVINCNDGAATIQPLLEAVLSRSDPLPAGADMASLLHQEKHDTGSDEKPKVPGNVLLIVGSPKIKNRSTSSVLGEFILQEMASVGWKTQSLTLKKRSFRENGRAELCAAIHRSDLIVLAVPLYVDSLPYLVTKAFEEIAAYRKDKPATKPQRFFTIINNGFPESHQNAPALAICRRFADRCGFTWAGSLAMGAGESLCSGQDLTESKRSGPPVKHVMKALEKAGGQLAQGHRVDATSQKLISKTPIPIVSFSIWRWIFARFGARWWKQQAFENRISHEDLLSRPYAE